MPSNRDRIHQRWVTSINRSTDSNDPRYDEGSISLTVFPAFISVVFGGRESVGEGDRERVQRWLPPHGPSCPAGAGGV